MFMYKSSGEINIIKKCTTERTELKEENTEQ